jgi:hypothetical protein
LLLAASIFLTGATGAFIGSTTSAHAITSVDELTDVNQKPLGLRSAAGFG